MADPSKKQWQAWIMFGIMLPLAGAPARAKEPPWVEVRTPHFTVISNGHQKQARKVALGFEQIHAVFSEDLPGLRTDSGAETIVLAVRDGQTMKTLVPEYWTRRGGAHPAGLFQKGWERDYAIIRLDQLSTANPIVYHEYVHKLLELNFVRMPLWLNEGMAEFFGNTRFEDNKTIIGVPSVRVYFLRNQTPLPLQEVLDATPNSPFYTDRDKVQAFYGECWGLTHFLMFGKNMGNGQHFFEYLRLLQTGMDSQKAFQQEFGDPKTLEMPFRNYISHFAFQTFTSKTPIQVDESTFKSREMSQAETDAMLGGFYTAFGDVKTAKQELEKALADDPRLALAYENQGFLDFDQGNDQEALGEFDKAVTLDPKSYLALYYQAMLSNNGKTDAQDLNKLNDALGLVLRLNQRFAPALVARSRLYARHGDLPDAVFTAQKAALLEPDRAGYHTNVAELLLLAKDYSKAISVAGVVAKRWSGPDSAEALAVLDQARKLGGIQATPEELAQEKDFMKYAAGTEAVEGTIASTTCGKPGELQLVLSSGGKQLTFHRAHDFGMGWSDTIWYGSDHFNACHHLKGMHAVVRYQPSSVPKDPEEMRWLEIRNDVPGSE
jgi:tetratricopeptide (TPR) repeat protein